MIDNNSRLPPFFREMCVRQLSRIGGPVWAEEQVDTPEFIEMAEKVFADTFNKWGTELKGEG